MWRKEYDDNILSIQSAKRAEREHMEKTQVEELRLKRRIGSTNYRVVVRCSADAAETMTDKIVRLIRNETLDNAEDCGIMSLPQMSRPA